MLRPRRPSEPEERSGARREGGPGAAVARAAPGVYPSLEGFNR
ncbi:hypothetical protein SCE1572_35040 [Sorangium cellulosum So0157-2]|uniref:Uncharacterized protein n=1 Tax=Sorangium cellulosum So0157-2 TaxID=1254432 RepID=S4Y364_SORCE|nr:hypothetical protein SCE1572_35040 [Sorangium cellulosum So0157-2]